MALQKLPLCGGFAGLMILTASVASADNAAQNKGRQVSRQDQQFINSAYQANETEIRLGQIAQDKATNGDVKTFAQHMVTDHSEIGRGLKTFVGEWQAELPPGMDKDHQAVVDRIAGLSGADFDREYMNTMVKDHEEAVSLFEKQANMSPRTPTDEWAAKVLPTLQDHLQMAVKTGREVGAPAAAEGAVPAHYKEEPTKK